MVRKSSVGAKLIDFGANDIHSREKKTSKISFFKCPQYFYNIFITNHRWLVVTSLNLNLTLRLLFYPNNNN